MKAAAIVSTLLAGAAAQPQPASPIGTKYAPSSTPGISFDVSALASPNSLWSFSDPSDYETLNSTYYFNIGYNAPTAQLPTACQSLTPPSAAYQVTTVGGSPICYRVGPDVSKSNVILGKNLFDPLNPQRGWQLTYPGGDITGCPNGVNRAYTIAFLCERTTPFPLPNGTKYQEFVDESNDCQYTAFTYSTAGCPVECPRVNGQVCSNNGVCGYDSTAQTARCFCYNGFNSADCSGSVNTFPSGAVAGATIGGILTGAIGLLGWSYFSFKGAGRTASAVPASEGFYPA